jgi:ABC-2 type transport system permease protein
MIKAFNNLLKPSNRSLVRELVVSDFKLRYKNSVLGYFWSLLKPLMLFGVLYLVFTKVVKVGNDIPYYPAYLLLGLVLWTFFVEATVQGMNSIMARGDMIRKVSVPKYTIVISTIVSAFVNFSLNMLVVVAFMIFSKVPFRPTIFIAPFLIIELVILSLAVASLLAALFVKFRDFSHIWEVALQILFYTTPIIYSLNFPPPSIAKLISISPLTQIFQDMRMLLISPEILTTKAVFHHWLGRIIPMGIVALISVLAIWYFRRSSRNFAEEL